MNIFKVGTSITLPAASIANAALSAQVSLLGSDIASAEILDDTIANADINTAAAIAKSKLAALNITDADVSSISGDKITGTIVSTHIVNGAIADTDINASAAIAATKINGTAAILGANTFTGAQTYNTGASLTAAVGLNEVLVGTSVVITNGGITASSGTFTGNAKVEGVIIAGSGPNTITTAAGLVDATKLTGAIPQTVTIFTDTNCELLTPAAIGQFCYSTGTYILNISTSTAVGGYAPLN
ncbi:MAG: hypothetical protein HY746_01465 [Elusimicrobia bacterium]|nr:hypothetical protein [Elusimicrobiota bacterium]